MKPMSQSFASRGVIRGSILLLSPQVAIEMVRECRKQGIRVLGLDAFKLFEEEVIQPVMDESIDLSTLPLRSKNHAWDEAEVFLSERILSDLYFEVVAEG